MRAALRSDRRTLCWLYWVEGSTADLYAWSGAHTLSFDGHDWVGVGAIVGMETVRKADALEHVQQRLSLSGLDPEIVAALDDSVRGREAKIWLAALDDGNEVIADPLLVQQLEQDTLSWERMADDRVTLSLTCFEALPFVGRAKGTKWSYEAQLEAFSGDVGFKYNAPIALTGAAVEWRQG